MKNDANQGYFALPFLVAAAALSVTACSQGEGSAPRGGEGDFDETTGALVAHLRRVPDDVRCIEINTSDWRVSQRTFDVLPGSEATLKIAPLLPGYVSFQGAAFSKTCAERWWGDDGGTTQTWVADYTSAYVTAGQSTPVSMTFRRLGSADVSVDFDENPNTSCDAGAWWPEAGPPSGCNAPADAGFVRTP